MHPFTFVSRYASRVKLITNDASKNAENKEIVRLKGVRDPLQTVSYEKHLAYVVYQPCVHLKIFFYRSLRS